MPGTLIAPVSFSATEARYRERPFSLAEICSLPLAIGPCQEFATLCDCARAGEQAGDSVPARREPDGGLRS